MIKKPRASDEVVEEFINTVYNHEYTDLVKMVATEASILKDATEVIKNLRNVLREGGMTEEEIKEIENRS